MRFSLSIEDTELRAVQEPSNPQPEQEVKENEDDCFIDDDVLCSLANMSLNLVVDKDSDDDNPFCNCDWQPDESNIIADTADIAYSNFIHFEISNVLCS